MEASLIIYMYTSTQTSHQEDPGSKTEGILIDELRISPVIDPATSHHPKLIPSGIAILDKQLIVQSLFILLAF
jgi:hypothetical protein